MKEQEWKNKEINKTIEVNNSWNESQGPLQIIAYSEQFTTEHTKTLN